MTPPGSRWADLGAGEGAFTLALAEVLGPGGTITAVDRNAHALKHLAASLRSEFPGTLLETMVADFTRPLQVTGLDGVVLANSLHFIRDAEKPTVLALVSGMLRPGGSLVLVEYGADRGNPWVPHPFSFPTWEELARSAGFVGTRLLATVPSRFLGSIYAAVSERPRQAGS